MRPLSYCGVLALVLMQSAAVSAGERLSLANVPAPAPLVADGPLAREENGVSSFFICDSATLRPRVGS